jgi:hypothetical protein
VSLDGATVQLGVLELGSWSLSCRFRSHVPDGSRSHPQPCRDAFTTPSLLGQCHYRSEFGCAQWSAFYIIVELTFNEQLNALIVREFGVGPRSSFFLITLLIQIFWPHVGVVDVDVLPVRRGVVLQLDSSRDDLGRV